MQMNSGKVTMVLALLLALKTTNEQPENCDCKSGSASVTYGHSTCTYSCSTCSLCGSIGTCSCGGCLTVLLIVVISVAILILLQLHPEYQQQVQLYLQLQSCPQLLALPLAQYSPQVQRK